MWFLKKKPKYYRVMVYKEIIELDKAYIVHNFVSGKRTIVKKKRVKK
jgi:hypothetical protein